MARALLRLVCLIVVGLALAACTPSTPPVDLLADPPPRNVDWRSYLGDPGRSHYSPLTQINRANIARLERAWVYDSGGPPGIMYASPLVVDGVLYGLSPRLVAFALNAATGEELWRAEIEVAAGAQRGLMWWENPDDESDQRLFFTAAQELIALRAGDGGLVPGFGEGGRLDLTPPVERTGTFTVTAPGVVFEDKLIMGFSTSEWADSFPGSIRAFSAVDGELLWQFDTIPAVGAPGSETWAEGALEHAGGANVWTGMALDEERGILFAPTGSATPDFVGATRLGDNLFANCLLAINARNGELLWHYQVVRHDLWDRDNPAPPTLVQLERDGVVIDAVALTTKSGHLYVFDRETGESMYPIIEVDTLPSTMPGEVPAPKQPLSTVAFSRQTFEVTNRTPEARAHVEALIKDYDLRPWAPPRVGTVIFYPWYDGGAEWGGSAFDPQDRRLILNANDAAGILTLREVPAGFSNYGIYAKHCGSCHGLDLEGTDAGPDLFGLSKRMEFREVLQVVSQGRGRMPGFSHMSREEWGAVLAYVLADNPVKDEPTTEVTYAHGGYVYLRDHEELPANTPPWGTLNSIDLATGEIVWKVPFGNFPSHPDLGFGTISYGGPVVTASGLVFIAATPDRKFRAYDKRDGSVLWETELSAAGYSTPAVYMVDGVQYVAISAGGGRQGPPSGSDYFAFRLPQGPEIP